MLIWPSVCVTSSDYFLCNALQLRVHLAASRFRTLLLVIVSNLNPIWHLVVCMAIVPDVCIDTFTQRASSSMNKNFLGSLASLFRH